MQLYIQRSQRDRGIIFRKTIFMIDVRLDLSADELRLMKKHKIFKQVIYRSEADIRHTNMMFLAARSFGNPFNAFMMVIFRFIAKMISVRCTYKSLYKGQHLACADIFELSANETSFHKACDRAISQLDAIRSYDGREDLYNFEGKEASKAKHETELLPNPEPIPMIKEVEVAALNTNDLETEISLPPSQALKAVKALSKSKRTTPPKETLI